jgi:hypothetical protein
MVRSLMSNSHAWRLPQELTKAVLSMISVVQKERDARMLVSLMIVC